MTKEMIISTNGHETRVAILEDDLLAEVFIERERNRGVVGNVYKGRVSKVLPGMQSAFVDLGLERDGFLYVSDVVNTMEEFERLSGDDEDEETPAAAAGAVGSGAAEVAGEAPAAANGVERRGRAGRGGRDRGERDKGPEPKIE
ncbi:MAG: ribonuclease, partial [Vicinamibacterales bacterium]